MGCKSNKLGTYMAIIKFKNFKKKCVFFLVPGNSQALLELPDMAVLNIINLNIDSIQKEIRECKTNRGQETHARTKDCTNKGAQSAVKQDGNGQQHQTNKLINYLYSSNNIDADKSNSKAMTWRIHEEYGKVFNGIGCFKGTFSSQLRLSIIDANLGYHNLKLDKQSSYLTIFACPLGRYRYKHLPFRAALAGDMFQHKIDKIFNDMPNVFGIADDISVIGYDKDGADHDEAVYKVLKQCQDVNLKLNKEKYHFRCTLIPFFGEVISRQGVIPDPQKVKALMEMLAPKNKKELQAFLGIINYLNKFSPGTSEACELLRKLTSNKATWTWNASY